ncbi:hypothetical protein D9M68_734410 [compost metagenome]
MLGVQALAAGQVEVAGRLRQRQGGAGEGVGDLGLPGRGDFRRVRRDAGLEQALLHVIAASQLDGEAPEVAEGREHALVAFLGTVAQALDPFAGAAQVVGDFLQGLGGDAGHALVAGAAQAVQDLEVPGVEEELLGDGHRVVAVGLLHQQQVAVGALVAAERQVVGVTAVGQQLGGVLQPVARLADQVEADVHQRQLFFQGRGLAAPFAQTLALDQGAVTEAQQVFDQIGIRIHHGPHMWPTSAGSS